MILIELYKIRNWVRGFTPLYISICAALLLDVKSNLKLDCVSILYYLGLFSFIIACVVSNELSNRCNNYGRIYDIQYANDKNKSSRKEIYTNHENDLKKGIRFFQYYSVFLFGILGLLFVSISYLSLDSKQQQSTIQYIKLRDQVDSLKSVQIRYENQIVKLKKENDSIRKIRLNEQFTEDNNKNMGNVKVKIKTK